MLLTVSINGDGYHPAGWRAPGRSEQSIAADLRSITALAESGGFVAALFGLPAFDSAARASGRVPIVHPDALPVVSSLVAVTKTIGLAAAYTLDRAEPHNIARSFATLDRLSVGRSAWIIELRGDGDHGREAECIEVVRKLWDSWDDDAFVADQAKGRVADSDKVRRINHTGAHFTVRGPLNVPRPNQGHPVLLMTDPGDAAGRTIVSDVADILLVDCADGEAARAIRDVARAAASRSRNPDAPKVMMNVFPILGATEAEARRTEAELNRLAGAALSARTPGLKFVGMPEQLCRRLTELHAAGTCDGFNILPPVLPGDLKLFVDQVIPLLRRNNLIPAQWPGRTLRERMGLPHPRSRYAKEPA